MKATTFSRLRAVAAKSPITLVCQVSTPFAGAFLALAAALLVAATNSPAASAQTVTYAGSGAVNFGSVNVCPSGKATPAPCSSTLTLTYNVTASGTLGTPQALTTGAPNLDYKVASGSTCAGSVTQGNTCKVNVAFAPTAPGARNGAVEIVDASGNLLATTYIYGTGVGPLQAFLGPEQPFLAVQATYDVTGIALDASGDAFITYYNPPYTGALPVLAELLAVDGTLPAHPVTKILTDKYSIGGFTVDGAGNVFFTAPSTESYPPTGGQSVMEIPAAGGYSTAKVVASGFTSPSHIAVDGIGNLFVSDTGNGEVVPQSVYEVPAAAGGYSTPQKIGAGHYFGNPGSIAVDANGNVFVVEGNADRITEFTASSGFTTGKEIPVGFGPGGLAIDPAGDLFFFLDPNQNVNEALAVDGVVPAKPVFLSFGSSSAFLGNINLDSHGNLFVTASSGGRIALEEWPLSTPQPLDFANTYVGQTSSDSPQSIQLQNRGNANLGVTAHSVSANWDLVPGSGSPEDCAASFTLVPSALCNLSVSFEPTEAGSLSGALTFTDNSLNVPGSKQSGALSGIALPTTSPYIVSLNHTYGAPYSVVVLNGENFGASKGSSAVSFSGIAPTITSWSGTSITVIVPANATSGNIVVTVDGDASNAFPFTVVPLPVIAGISPASGPAGTIVTINGKNLLDYENKGTVSYGGYQQLQILSQSSTALQVQVPSGRGSDDFEVYVNNTELFTPVFTLLNPDIGGLNTTYGAPYSVVLIDGANFGASQGSSYVTFSDGDSAILSPVYYWSNTEILATVPPNATTGHIFVVVQVNGSAIDSNAASFTVLPMPKLTGISPTSGPVGTVVTISGNNLLDYEDKGAVTFNGTSLPLLSDSSTAIKVAIPAGATSASFHVLVNDTGMNTPTFTVTP